MKKVYQCDYCGKTYTCKDCCGEHEDSCPANPKNQSSVVYTLQAGAIAGCSHVEGGTK